MKNAPQRSASAHQRRGSGVTVFMGLSAPARRRRTGRAGAPRCGGRVRRRAAGGPAARGALGLGERPARGRGSHQAGDRVAEHGEDLLSGSRGGCAPRRGARDARERGVAGVRGRRRGGRPAHGVSSSAMRLIAARRASHCVAMLGHPAGGLVERSGAHAVADLAACAPALDEAGAIEGREVLDHRHAADRQLAGQRRRGGFAALGEQAEHAPAGGVRQRGEHPLRRRAHHTATRSAYARSSPVSNSQPALLAWWFSALLVLAGGQRGKAALDHAQARVLALGLERELDQRRVALDGLVTARVLERRPAVGEAVGRLDRDHLGRGWCRARSSASTIAPPGRRSISAPASPNQRPRCSASVISAQTRSTGAPITVSRSI